MMKRAVLILSLLLVFVASKAQNQTVEELQAALSRHPQPDTFRVNRLNELSNRTEITPSLRDRFIEEALQLSRRTGYTNGESAALAVKALNSEMSQSTGIAKQAVALAQKTGDKATLYWAYRSLGSVMLNTSEGTNSINIFRQALQYATATGNPDLIINAQLSFVDYYKTIVINYPLALEWSLKALHTAEQSNYTPGFPRAYRNIGILYLLIGDNEKSFDYMQKALTTSRQTGNNEVAMYTLNDIGERYRLTGKYPEALKAYQEAAQLITDTFNTELNQSNVADVYVRMGNDSMSLVYAFRSLKGARQLKDTVGTAWIDCIVSRAYLHINKPDSAIYYGRQGYEFAVKTHTLEFKRENSKALFNAYLAKKDFERSLYFYKIYISSRDSMLNNEVTNKTYLAQFNYDLQKKQAEISVLNKDKQLQQAQVQRQRYLLVASATGLILILTTLILLYRNNRQRQKAYALLQEQKQQVQAQRDQTNMALHDLKLAQSQLIQSEKMASLGELTAGIAHEIQNPLNFVNNFSEVNRELIEELKSQKSKLKSEEQDEILNDIDTNLEKVLQHGKRADAIVKGMLQHSRQTKGVKESTDINTLCDEYLRLSYHGLRAKDKNFNADFKTDFDESIGKINIVPQDIGRVLLNLFNNAFYAVSEKQNTAGETYKPLVTVATKSLSPLVEKGWVEVIVIDNANGIPKNIIDKIFQPFFTTKPTGQGTGLGLSLSYDIVKAHGGELKVETSEGEGAEFVIQLPLPLKENLK